MTSRPSELPRSCRRNDRHDAHEWQEFSVPLHCPGYDPTSAEQEQAATDRARALLAPLAAKARELKDRERAELRATVLREAADHLSRQADELWSPGTRAHTVMHGDATELRRLADEAHSAPIPTPRSAARHVPVPRLFHLQRDRDISGVSGIGRVADGVLWPDGPVTIRWRGARPSTVHWDALADAEAVHGHGGATRIIWADEEPRVDGAAS
jgi:hypothetical protein